MDCFEKYSKTIENWKSEITLEKVFEALLVSYVRTKWSVCVLSVNYCQDCFVYMNIPYDLYCVLILVYITYNIDRICGKIYFYADEVSFLF